MQQTEIKGHCEEDFGASLNIKSGLSEASGVASKSADATQQRVPDSTCCTEYLDSDEMIVKLVQEEFNAEVYNESRGSKNRISELPTPYQSDKYSDNDMDDNNDYENDNFDDPILVNWDCTKTKQKKLPTNYDSILLLPRHRGVDAVDKEMSKLSSEKSRKLQSHAENVVTNGTGLDETSRSELDKFVSAHILKRINGIIAVGSEARIIHADGNLDRKYEMRISRECAIKIFKKCREVDIYNNLKDDYRFKMRLARQGSKMLINMWAEKEMLNMDRLHKAGLPCPDIIHLKDNILIMSFLGENQVAAPKLKFAKISNDTLKVAYMQIIQNMRTMYKNAAIVHGDLSEHNILWFNGKCWYIDLAQSVHTSHPSALQFLMNDCTNIISYFERCGLRDIITCELRCIKMFGRGYMKTHGLRDMKTKEELFEYITSMSVDVLKQ